MRKSHEARRRDVHDAHPDRRSPAQAGRSVLGQELVDEWDEHECPELRKGGPRRSVAVAPRLSRDRWAGSR